MFKPVHQEATQLKTTYANLAMKIVRLAPDQIATIATLVPKERSKTEQVLKKIQNTVLVAALLDFIHLKSNFASPATKIVNLVPDQIAIIATLVPLGRRKTEEVLSRIQNTAFNPVL